MFFFLVDGGIEDPNTALKGPSLARQQNAIEMAFLWLMPLKMKWPFAGGPDGGPRLNAGLVVCGFTGDPDQYC